jgi:hypothetical protein
VLVCMLPLLCLHLDDLTTTCCCCTLRRLMAEGTDGARCYSCEALAQIAVHAFT